MLHSLHLFPSLFLIVFLSVLVHPAGYGSSCFPWTYLPLPEPFTNLECAASEHLREQKLRLPTFLAVIVIGALHSLQACLMLCDLVRLRY